MPSESSPEKLPFEPRQKKKKATPEKLQPTQVKQYRENSAYDKKKAGLSAIPDAVSKRMITRMMAFSGIPTFFGVSSFFIFYLIVTNELFKVPPSAVVLVSMGFFGLGVVGLSYGILSASWDENEAGSFWGFSEFKLNFTRMTSAWQSARKEARSR
jgi:hypothetical protein